MRLLFLTDRLPYPPIGGSPLRVWSLLRGLAPRHRLELIAFAPQEQPPPPALQALCSRVDLVVQPPRFGEARISAYFEGREAEAPWVVQERQSDEMSRLVAERSAEVDAVVAVQLGMTQYLDSVRGALRVYDAHDVESSVLEQVQTLGANPAQRLYAAREARRVKSYESELDRKTDLVLTVTEHDGAGLRALQPRLRTRTVPICVALEDYPALWRPGRPRLAFFGDMAWAPNTDAAVFLCREVLPRLGTQVEVVLAGKSPPPAVQALAGPNVRVTGFVPRMEEVLEGDTIAVVPLRAGSGMRVKILEAMAWSLPVVSTRLGCTGIEHGGALLEAEGAEGLSAALDRLLADPELRRQLGESGRRLVGERHGHLHGGELLTGAIQEILHR